MATPESLQRTISLSYRIAFLYLEPVFAFFGAVLAHFNPTLFLHSMQPSPASSWFHPASQVIFDQLAATYFFIAFVEVFVLRATSELRVWRMVLLGILLCDILHVYAAGKALGWHVTVKPWLWRPEDLVNFILLYGNGGLRAAFLAGVGFAKEKVGGKSS